MARAGVRLQGRAYDHQSPARQGEADLGQKFDLRFFDDAVVLGGNVTMDVLGKNVDDYIARAKSA